MRKATKTYCDLLHIDYLFLKFEKITPIVNLRAFFHLKKFEPDGHWFSTYIIRKMNYLFNANSMFRLRMTLVVQMHEFVMGVADNIA